MTPNPPLSTKAIWLLCAVVAGLAVSRGNTTTTTPVVLRLGLVYGRGILLARRRLLCVWRDPTRYQLLSTADYLRAVEAAIVKPAVRGNLPRRRRRAGQDSAIPRCSMSSMALR
jgi:hypothetical protein